MPWSLDDALRRRLEKRIYIGLPDKQAREEIIRRNLCDVAKDTNVSYSQVARDTEGLCGSDLKILCREAAFAPIRRLVGNKSIELLVEMTESGQLLTDSIPPITVEDINEAAQKIKSSVDLQDEQNCIAFNDEYGSNLKVGGKN